MEDQLPTGTVGFLFTDVEESTRLAARIGPGYTDVIGQHFSLIRDCVAREGGVVVKSTGDGVFAAFDSAQGALAAASSVQRAMVSHHWPVGGQIKLRVGVHVGEADLVDDDYVGLEVNRAARVMAAGHGGQVLVSESARLSAGDGFEFKELGRHLLRGLESEELLYQVVVPGLPAEFPPLRTASAVRNNLPARLSSLIGRKEDLSTVARLVGDHRLVTILGPGGVGKTSLAVAVASRIIDRFPGGVVFVDLSSVADPSFVVPTIASELDAEPKTIAGIVEALREEGHLLVLDNMEQVVSSGHDVSSILEGARSSRVLVTSQVPLRVGGEQRYVLGPLGATTETDGAGVELFLDRARAVSPGFDADSRTVADLVQLLDGLPLAIELVAARANLFSADEMLDRLRSGRMSYRAAEGVPRRHRSLHEALEWSYSLLDDGTRGMLDRLGVFAGSMTLEGAETIGKGTGGDPIDQIAELVDRSLLVRSLENADRIGMLDSVRSFARARLDETANRNQVEDRFVDFFQAMCRDAHDGLQSDRGEWWRARLDEDLENIREVLDILQRDDRPAEGLEILGNTWRFYQSRGHLGELELWLDRFFSLPGSEEHVEGTVKGLMARAAVHYWRQEVEEAVAGYQDAVDRARRTQDRSLLAEALYGLATSLIVARQSEEALGHLEECRELYADLGDRNGLADVAAGEAFAAFNARGLAGLGPKFREAAELYESAGRRTQATQALYAQTAVALVEGRCDDARELAGTGLRRGLEMNDVFLQVWGLEYMARIALEEDELERSALLAGAAAAAADRFGGGWSPETIGLEDTEMALVRELGADATARLVEPGRRLTLQEALEMALPEGEPSRPQ